MKLLRLATLCTVLFGAAPLFAQSAPSTPPAMPVVPPDAELQIGLDARTLYEDETFDAIMTLVESSGAYQGQASQLEAWGFDPRSDVAEFVFAVDRFAAEDAEFVFVITGDLSHEEMTLRMNEQGQLTPGQGALGQQWTDARGTTFVMTEHVAIAGVGEMFAHAQRAVLNGGEQATAGAPSTVWLRLRVSDEVRGAHPALSGLHSLLCMLEVDATPAIRLRAELRDDTDAVRAGEELRNALAAVGEIPEVEALRIEGLVRDAEVAVDGRSLRMDTEIDATTWNQFSEMLSDLIQEELR